MIGYLAGLIILAAVISYFWKKDVAFIIPMCVLFTIIVLYIFSISGAMLAGVYAIYAVGLLGVIGFIYSAVRHKKGFFKSVSWTPIAVMAGFALLSLWAHNGRQITLWDEFSHWGRVVKDMYVLNALGTHPDSMVIFQNYPPGTALLEYLFVRIRGSFVEAEMYHAMNVLYFSLVMPLFAGLKRKNTFKIIIIMLIAVILPTGFYDTMHDSLYVDGILGVLFAYVLIVYFTNRLSTFTLINISLALFVLAIVKQSGAGLAALAVFVIAVDLIFIKKADVKEHFKNSNKISAALGMALPVLFILGAKLSWSAYLSSSAARISFDAGGITLDKIITVFVRFSGTQLQQETLLSFLKVFVTVTNSSGIGNFIFNIPPFAFIAAFIFIGALLYYKSEGGTKKRIIVTGITLFISAMAYMLTLLCSYLFVFTELEGSNLASYSRYVGTFYLGIYMFLAAYILHTSKDTEEQKNKMPSYLMVFMVIIIVTVIEAALSFTVLAPFAVKKGNDIRAEYECIGNLSNEVDSGEVVYFIDIGSQGYSYFVGEYLAYPVSLSGIGSIGTQKYYSGDYWTKIVSTEELEEALLNNYNYLYVFRTDYDFNEVYGHLFGGEQNIAEHTLYYVDKSGSETILKKAED